MVRSGQNLPHRHWSSFELQSPPPTLYRVHYRDTATSFGRDGFEARDSREMSDIDNLDMHHCLKRHLNWTKHGNCESPMISTFGNLVHARRWAQKWKSKHPYGWYDIATIDYTHQLHVYRAVELVSVLDVPVADSLKADQLRDEYLIFGRIDFRCITGFEDENGDDIIPQELLC